MNFWRPDRIKELQALLLVLRREPRPLAGQPPSEFNDSADQILVREPSLCRSHSEARIWSKKRVWVYVDHERLAGWIDAKIEAGIAAQPEQVPAGHRQLLEFLGKFGLPPFQAEAARCTDIGSAVRFSFCIEIHDLGRVAFEPLKQDLRNGEHLHS